jgi:phosphoserine phosphatase
LKGIWVFYLNRFLVVFDVDSTLIQDEVIELLADAAGKRKEVAEVTDISNLIDPSIAAESQVANIPNANSAPLSDEDLAKKFRSDADRLSKEAAELRRQAEALAPTKKKTTSKA